VFEGTQLDLIYLLGVLALFLIGALAPILNRRASQLLPWNWLGMFAFCRGIHDLLSLPALDQLIPGYFEAVRLVLLFLSLIFLIEFGRAGSNIPQGRSVPRYLVYIPLTALILLGRVLGIHNLSSIVSLGLSALGGAWSAWALFQATLKLPDGKETLIAAGIIMFSYGVASCFTDNSESLVALMGISIHMVRSLLAIGLAACIFRVSQIAILKLNELRIQKIYQYLTQRTAIGLIFILAVGLLGGLGINYFSTRAVHESLTKNQRTILRLHEIVNNEMEKADRLVQLLAGSSQIFSAVVGPEGRYYSDRYGQRYVEKQAAQANDLLDRYSQTEEGYGVCYIMNMSGVTLASSNRNQPDSFVGKNYGFRPYFKQAALGLQGRYFALGVTSKVLGYYTSAPIRNDQGVIIGVAVIKRVIRTSGELKNAFDSKSLSFLVDPHGIVVLSNQPKYVLFSLWPLKEETKKELINSKQFGEGPFSAILEQKPLDGKEYQLEGQRMMVLTQPMLMEGWKIFHFGSTQAIPFYRLLGAAAILILGFAMIGFYVSWDLSSYYTACIVASEPSETGDRQMNEQLHQSESKYQELVQDISLMNGRLHQSEQKYQTLVQDINLMSEMADLLQGCNSSQDAIPVITKYMQRLFPNLSGGLYLSSLKGTFEVMGIWGEAPPEEQSFALDDCWALRRGRQYLVEDADASLPCPHLSEKLPGGYQCWPLAAQGKTLGLLHLRQSHLRDNPNPLSEQQQETNRRLISSVVDQLTMVLVNLKLREASQVKGPMNAIVR
jgi:Cache domain